MPNFWSRLWNWLTNWFKPKPQPQPILIDEVAKNLLNTYGSKIAMLVGRSAQTATEVTFSVVETADWPATTAGRLVTLNKSYFDTHPDDEGAIIHEISHAIQQAPKYEGDFTWLIEGLADFVRYNLGFGSLEHGDPHLSYRYAAGFWNWLYLKDITEYSALIVKINNGILPENLDQLLQEYSKTYSSG